MPEANFVVSRDYLNVKLWDLRMARALYSANVTDGMERNINKLYSAGALDDEFFLTLSSDGK